MLNKPTIPKDADVHRSPARYVDLWEPLPNKSGKLSQDLGSIRKFQIIGIPKKNINKSIMSSVELDGCLQVHMEVYKFTFCEFCIFYEYIDWVVSMSSLFFSTINYNHIKSNHSTSTVKTWMHCFEPLISRRNDECTQGWWQIRAQHSPNHRLGSGNLLLLFLKIKSVLLETRMALQKGAMQ